MKNNAMKIYFVGAGPGAPDLITLRGRELLGRADVIVYAGSLVNPALLGYAGANCEIRNSASMTLEEVIEVLVTASSRGDLAVRLHTGDPSLYGAIREQMEALRARGIDFAVVPGVSSFSAAAAALCAEYTLPGVSQSLIVTRAVGRTPVPGRESLVSFAAHRASMVLFLSSGMVGRACEDLIAGGYDPATPAAIAYKVSWPDERVLRGTLATIAGEAQRAGIKKTALILVGNFLGDNYERSKLYDPAFSHGFRNASDRREVREVPSPGGCGRNPRPDPLPETTSAPVFAAFTDDGVRTALKLQSELGGVVFAPVRFTEGHKGVEAIYVPLAEWAAQRFHDTKALVFVSAAGIAVRAVAPLLESKVNDPAVVCLDDLGRNVIPLLSGHLGGANELAERIAEITGGRAIVTTSTDVHGIVAADSWARAQGMTVENPQAVRAVSGAMLAGGPDEKVGVAITEENLSPPWPVTLILRPKNLVLGIGSKKGITQADLDEAITDFLAGAGVSLLSLAAAASIDLKKGEPAIVTWCASKKLAYHTYAAAELAAVEEVGGGFAASERVRAVTGTDNICERSAVLAAQGLAEGGRVALTRSKTIYPGITLALAKFYKGKNGEPA